jgi:alpha-1,3-mannosyltransferase
MNLLLVVPGLAFVLLQAIGLDRSITQALIVTQSQVRNLVIYQTHFIDLKSQGVFAYEFVRTNWRSYVFRAFQLNRQFLYKWTVNWRFIPESIFLSTPFAVGLLSAHAALLLLFATTRWTKPSQRSLLATIQLYLHYKPADEDITDAISERIDEEFIMTTILTANSIGMLCARSLHYQFYSWTAWATPYLLWRAGFHPILIYAIWGAQEWAWNVYPSTPTSSGVAVGMLAVTVAGVWWGTRKDMAVRVKVDKKKE